MWRKTISPNNTSSSSVTTDDYYSTPFQTELLVERFYCTYFLCIVIEYIYTGLLLGSHITFVVQCWICFWHGQHSLCYSLEIQSWLKTSDCKKKIVLQAYLQQSLKKEIYPNLLILWVIKAVNGYIMYPQQ